MAIEPIAAVVRALDVLRSFGPDQYTVSLAELARRTGNNKPTLLRVLATLEAQGFIRRLADGRYRLGPELLRLGSVYRDSFDLAAHVRPVLAKLVAATGESSAFYVAEGDTRVCLCRAESPRSIRHHVHEGQRLPLDRGGAGRVLGAFLRQSGDLYERMGRRAVITLAGDRVADVSAVCAPVFGAHDALVGALQVSGPSARFTEDTVPTIETEVLKAAATLIGELGGNAAHLAIQGEDSHA